MRATGRRLNNVKANMNPIYLLRQVRENWFSNGFKQLDIKNVFNLNVKGSWVEHESPSHYVCSHWDTLWVVKTTSDVRHVLSCGGDDERRDLWGCSEYIFKRSSAHFTDNIQSSPRDIYIFNKDIRKTVPAVQRLSLIHCFHYSKS